MTSNGYTPSQEAILAHVSRINASSFGRSKNLKRLLAYLVEREIEALGQDSLSYKAPKEIEIAMEVFGKGVEFNPSEDSTVRAHVSNLRKRLEAYYAHEGAEETFKILVPVGNYRLAFLQMKEEEVSTEELAAAKPLPLEGFSPNRFINRWLLGGAVAAMLLLSNGLTWTLSSQSNSDEKPLLQVAAPKQKKHLFWQQLDPTENAQFNSTIIVIGDRTDKVKPGETKYITKASALALRNVLAQFDDAIRVKVKLASELTIYDLKSYNIIYLGSVESMDMLNIYFKGSAFNLNRSEHRLELPALKQSFDSPKNVSGGYTDYALFARFKGARGNQIMVMSGFSEPSLLLLSWYMTESRKVNSKEFASFMQKNQLNLNDDFEVLFKVPGMGGVDMEYEFLYGGKVDREAIWGG